MPKCRCGNAVASNARFCPKCGHRFTSTLTLILAACFGIIALAAMFSHDSSSDGKGTQPPSPAEQAEKQKKDARFYQAVLGAKQLRDSMRNPDSFKLSQVLMMDDGAVCYQYRAQNGFGGLNVGHAVLSPKGQFKANESAGFRGLWNKECAGKTGTDEVWEVGLAAGFHGVWDDK
jgi:hypothetical protein